MVPVALACLGCGAAVRGDRVNAQVQPRKRWSRPEDTPSIPSARPEPGSLPLRLAAHIIDNIMLVPAIVLLSLWVGAGDVHWGTRNSELLVEELRALGERLFWPVLALQFAYFALFEASAMRGTPGKWFLGLAVGDNDGDQLGLIHTALRAALKLAMVTVFAPVVLLAFFSRRNQALYDKLAGTLVIKRDTASVNLSDSAPPEQRAAPAP